MCLVADYRRIPVKGKARIAKGGHRLRAGGAKIVPSGPDTRPISRQGAVIEMTAQQAQATMPQVQRRPLQGMDGAARRDEIVAVQGRRQLGQADPDVVGQGVVNQDEIVLVKILAQLGGDGFIHHRGLAPVLHQTATPNTLAKDAIRLSRVNGLAT